MPSYTSRNILTGSIDRELEKIYGKPALADQRLRYAELVRNFYRRFADPPTALFSSPGRTELGGNHTDHNRGRVLAASIQLDKIAAVAPRKDKVVELVTEGFPEELTADLSDLNPSPSSPGKAAELVRGVAAYFKSRGYTYGGFSAYLHSTVAMGSGLSSSASLEVLIGKIFSSLYHRGEVPPVELARAGHYAENTFFHKPCGLMDQLACAVGGIISIDFADPAKPLIEEIDFDFGGYGYQLMIMDTGGDHSGLTEEYAAIPGEMRCIAEQLGAKVLRECDPEMLLRHIGVLRKSCGDRAVLRAFHFFRENQRVDAMKEALRFHDINAYLRLVEQSGNSSWTLLQNCLPGGAVRRQALAFALGYLKELCPRGFFRVHGGGFAGTVQGYVPMNRFADLRGRIDKEAPVNGEKQNPSMIKPLSIRPYGVIQIGEQ